MRDENVIFSVGNFDPLVLAGALDFLRIALAPVVTTACERLIKLMQARFSGLVDGLSRSSDTPETTFPHLPYVAAALTGEARLSRNRSPSSCRRRRSPRGSRIA